MDDYVEEDYLHCPACGHSPVRSRKCTHCKDGWLWGYDEDPTWYGPDEFVPCDQCDGLGFHHWCPECGADLNLPKWRDAMDAQFSEFEQQLIDLYYDQ